MDENMNPTNNPTNHPTNNMNPSNEDMADGEKPRAGREMLVQLQQMIDNLSAQAGPVMREVAAKAAELAAIAGEKAGPLAHKAAGMTESAGQKIAARSKEMAADLRRPREGADATDATPGSEHSERLEHESVGE